MTVASPHRLKANRTKPDKGILTALRTDIASFRQDHWPPFPEQDDLQPVRDLPIYIGTPEAVARYQAKWLPLFERAWACYPEATLSGPEHEPLPSTLQLPLFAERVERLHLTRTYAKESRAFGAVETALAHCGAYTDAEQTAMREFMSDHPDGALVAHRLFIDLRAYVFAQNERGILQPPERMRYYRCGLIMAVLPHFEIIDSRQKPRKQRSDAYQDPLGHNEVWTIFGREGRLQRSLVQKLAADAK